VKDIILTGPKYSGKTSAGKILASLCSCVFIDLDELILQRTGKTPRRLFCDGQDVFKKAEAEAITALANSGGAGQRRVIAAGGGIIDNEEALAILKKIDAIIVYLNVSADCAWNRIAADEELPHFLKTENPQETHRTLHERRAASCLQIANIVIDAEGKTPEETAIELFGNFGC